MATIILLIFIAAFLAPITRTVAGRNAALILAVAPLIAFLYLLRFVPAIANGETIVQVVPFVPIYNLNFSFLLDGLSLSFGLLISGIGVLVVLYTGAYLHGNRHLGRFYMFLLAFMASMLGVVLANNIIALFVFWELTSITSYLLIGFEHKKPEARTSALQALVVTGGGGLALLAGLVLLGFATGTYELNEMLVSEQVFSEHALYMPILILILLGCFTKSAQFPFHFWLPNAMSAPTPASAYLHSSTMVKAGVYLMFRLHPVLGGTSAWFNIVVTAGVITMFVAGFLALRQQVLKPLLAYTTVAALAILTTAVGIGTPLAIKGAMTFLFVHAFYKAALFMVAGALDHETGEKNVEKLGGLRKAMPITAAAAGIAALSMAGIPPLLGFIGKEVLYDAKWQAASFAVLIAAVAVFANVANVFVAIKVGIKPFWGQLIHTPKHPHDGPYGLWIGAVVLAALGVFFGLFPFLIANNLVQPGASAVYGDAVTVKLVHWHGFNVPLLLSFLTLTTGIVIFTFRHQWRAMTAWTDTLAKVGPEAGYFAGLRGMVSLAEWQTGVLQSGYLRNYFLTVIGFILVVPGYFLFFRGGVVWPEAFVRPQLTELILGLVIIAAAWVTAFAKTRLTAIVALGVVGYGIAIIFILYGAPDLAMTQLIMETLVVMLFVLVFQRLKPFTIASSAGTRLRDLAIALAGGTFFTFLAIAAFQVNLAPPISEWHSEQSYPAGQGRNIVNVILVDFRALDTLGEITVLAIAALGAIALLKLRPKKGGASS